MPRTNPERQFREAFKDALFRTGEFDEVTLRGLPESHAIPASKKAVASIQPGSTRMVRGWDSVSSSTQLDYLTQLSVVVMYRHHDDELRDAGAEDLAQIVGEVVNGSRFVEGFHAPQKTLVSAWQWQPPVDKERRIAVTVTYESLRIPRPPGRP